jgi:CHAD domain-containing protein
MLTHPAEAAGRLLAELSARAEALLDAARRVRSGGDDEAIHDLRVANRRLAETLSLWRAALEPAPARKARARLARLRRALGDVRETEVHLDLLRLLARDASPAETAAVRLLRRRLDARLARARRAAGRLARARRITRILRRVERAGTGLAARIAETPGLLPHTAGRAARRLALARAALGRCRAAVPVDDATLHSTRIAVKKARYSLESLAATGEREDEVALRELRRAQRDLGAVHDWVTFGTWIGRERERHARHAAEEAATEFAGMDEEPGLAVLAERVSERAEAARAQFHAPAPVPRREAGG